MLTTTPRISRPSPWATLKTGYTALFLIFASLVSAPANADYDAHMYCKARALLISTQYYSGIFRGDYSRVELVKWEFYEYLKGEGFKPSPASLYCFSENSQSAAADEAVWMARREEVIYDDLVFTNWAPDSASADSFSPNPLRDFNITLYSGQREVQICVRDHECEDGDRIQVSVNSGSVFYGELFNSWDCTDVPVQQGRNRVELYALNGSGNKGNCSYRNVNTGEIQVRGANSQTQSWRHRGGAGSSANIIVEVE